MWCATPDYKPFPGRSAIHPHRPRRRDGDLVESAIDTLRDYTQQYFGYHESLTPKEKGVAFERWRRWWRQNAGSFDLAAARRRVVIDHDTSI